MTAKRPRRQTRKTKAKDPSALRVLRGYGDTLRIGDIFTMLASDWTTQDRSAFVLVSIRKNGYGTITIGAVRLGGEGGGGSMDVYGSDWHRTFTKHGTALRSVLREALRTPRRGAP